MDYFTVIICKATFINFMKCEFAYLYKILRKEKGTLKFSGQHFYKSVC